MDGNGFDELTRRLATGRSRRSVLRGLMAGGTALVAARAGTSLAAPKVDLCHWDASSGTYQWLSISQNGWLTGHKDQHPEDFLRSNCCTAGECGTDTICATYSCNAGTCAQTPHPVDCAYSDFDEWGACSATCGGGTQTRTRTIVTDGACGGILCDEESLSEQRTCNTGPCFEDCLPGFEPSDEGCLACGIGTFSAGGLACVPCGLGTYVDYQGADQCSACATGSYIDVTGAASCIDCECDGLCDAITGECAGGGLVPLFGECSVDGDCQSGQCGCDAPPGFPACFCREETCLAEGSDCSGGFGAVSCCTGDCTLSGGVGTCLANICNPPCPAGQNCAFGTTCMG
ncbi:MAG TPA: hypothetical protein VFP05_01340 [Thermomicrobiales bacterium]|nr:hypothetical protein [Thermomicrobiales bacterium]